MQNSIHFTMSTTTYKLYYFDARGRGEPIRQLFTVAGVNFEDIRITKNETEWDNKYKKVAPWGQTPFLEIIENGVTHTLCQSHVILRYLARQFGLSGSTPIEEAYVEMFADNFEDYILSKCVHIFRAARDPTKKKELQESMRNTTLPQQFALFENKLKENNGGRGWLVGNEITWVDVLISAWMDWFEDGVGVVPPLDSFPALKAYIERCHNYPQIRTWRTTRPKTAN